MKNRRNIIEQKYPPKNPNDLWMKDDILYKSTHEGWTPLTAGNRLSTNGIISTTWLKLKDKRDAGKLIPGILYRITDYNCTTTQENTRSAGHQFDIVLLALSENKLAEEGWAMEHPADIYNVTFESDNVTIKCYVYDIVTEGSPYVNIVNCETLLGTTISLSQIQNRDYVNKTMTAIGRTSTMLVIEDLQYRYFQYSNLSAWKVWYCLDNDTSRFAWADDSVDGTVVSINTDYLRDTSKDNDYDGYYGWTRPAHGDLSAVTRYTTTKNPQVGDTTFDAGKVSPVPLGEVVSVQTEGTGLPNGRGVIYRLIDEWNNDVGYDFKNIQFVRKLTDGIYDPINGTNAWVYTFNVWYDNMCQDASIVGNTLPNDEGMITGVYNNLIETIGGYLFHTQNARQALSDNCILSGLDEYRYYYGIQNCSIDASSSENTISLVLSIENICLKWSSRNKIKGIGAIFMNCNNFDYNSDKGGIYIQKKRVLTES